MFARSDACLAAEVLPTMASLASWHLWQNALSPRASASPRAARRTAGHCPRLGQRNRTAGAPPIQISDLHDWLDALVGPYFYLFWPQKAPKRKRNVGVQGRALGKRRRRCGHPIVALRAAVPDHAPSPRRPIDPRDPMKHCTVLYERRKCRNCPLWRKRRAERRRSG